jgi:hypothetical protein
VEFGRAGFEINLVAVDRAGHFARREVTMVGAFDAVSLLHEIQGVCAPARRELNLDLPRAAHVPGRRFGRLHRLERVRDGQDLIHPFRDDLLVAGIHHRRRDGDAGISTGGLRLSTSAPAQQDARFSGVKEALTSIADGSIFRTCT